MAWTCAAASASCPSRVMPRGSCAGPFCPTAPRLRWTWRSPHWAPFATSNGSQTPAWHAAYGASRATPAAAPSTRTAWSPMTSSSPATSRVPPQPMYGYQYLAVEHWGNAISQAEVAAHNMVSSETKRWPHLEVPKFWSVQFGTEIKSVGVPSLADEVAIVQG